MSRVASHAPASTSAVPPITRHPTGSPSTARTLVHAMDGLLHHAPADADTQRARVRRLTALVDG